MVFSPVSIILKQKTFNVISAKTKEKAVHTIPDCGTTAKELFLCLVASQATILAYSQTAVLVPCCEAEIMKIGTPLNVVEGQFSMTTRGHIDIQAGEQFYVYIANILVKRVNLPKFMIFVSASDVPLCFIQARNGDQCATDGGGQASTLCNSINVVHAVRYKPSGGRDEQVDSFTVLEGLNRKENWNW